MAGLVRHVAPNLKNTIALPDYSVELTYLGDGKIPHDANYRCTFELVEAGNPPTAVAADAPIPLASQGKKYRIMVHDNHAAKATETASPLNILGDGANTTSKPDCYTNNNWIRNIRPAVGFKVTVKKFAAGAQTTFSPGEVLITWKIKDLEEEFSQVDECRNPNRPKEFLKEFFKWLKRRSNVAASKEDDNCSTSFGGVRQRDGVTDACDVLFKSPFNTGAPSNLAHAADPPGTPRNDPYRGKLAKSDVNPAVAPDGKPVGVSEVYFFPPPISGDNYVFEIGLASGSGAPLDFTDPDGNRVKTYATGPLTMWRKVKIDMLVTFDNVILDYIQWNDVKNAYRAAFMEVVEPAGGAIVRFDEPTWNQILTDYLQNNLALAPADIAASVFDYANYFLPQLPAAVITALQALPQYNSWTAANLYSKFGPQVARLFLDQAYADQGKTSPRTDVDQNTCPGLYVFLCKRLQNNVGLLGQYMGDREFFMVTVGDTTCTFAHEMGHALYLRHALTSFDTSKAVHLSLDIAHTRGAWLDHDQGDAVVCTMAYENDYYRPNPGVAGGITQLHPNAVEWHFCAVCLLKLRFWDIVKLRANRRFRRLIFAKMQPLRLADVNYNNLGNFTLPRGNAGNILCFAEAEATNNNMGGPYKKNVANMLDSEWRSSVPARADFNVQVVSGVTYAGRLEASPANTGKTQVRFTVLTDEMRSNSVRGAVT